MRTPAAIALIALALVPGCVYGARAEGDVVAVGIHHSRFTPARFSFEAGQTVRFAIHNDDPIDHEFILGDETVQKRHEFGRDRHHHGEVPGEVSVPAGETRTATYTFADSGTLTIGCHLPGHFGYGMRATVVVTSP
jgi:uncharacterized cupredoxin-like copper-binding protein